MVHETEGECDAAQPAVPEGMPTRSKGEKRSLEPARSPLSWQRVVELASACSGSGSGSQMVSRSRNTGVRGIERRVNLERNPHLSSCWQTMLRLYETHPVAPRCRCIGR